MVCLPIDGGQNDGLMKRFLGLLAGADMERTAMLKWVRSAEIVWAADGAVNWLVPERLPVDVMVGDLDSASPDAFSLAREIVKVEEQETTDCDKLLKLAWERGYREITIAGLEGDLLDHALGSLHSLAKSELRIRIALRRGVAYIVRPGSAWSVRANVGARTSLVPLTACDSVYFTGVKWPVEAKSMDPLGFSSVSNVAVDREVEASLDSGCALLTVEWPESELPHWNDQ